MSSVRMASLNPSPSAAEPVRIGNAAPLEAQRGQRMRGDHLEPLGHHEPRRVGGHEERRHATRPGAVGVAACDHAVEVGNTTVGDPRLGAIEHPIGAVAARTRGERAHIGAGVGFGERERRDRLTTRDARQPVRAQRVGALEHERPRAEALHGEGKVGESIVPGERFAHNAQ
jgi:hypothetical protein